MPALCSRRRHDLYLPRLFTNKYLWKDRSEQRESVPLLRRYAEIQEIHGELFPKSMRWELLLLSIVIILWGNVPILHNFTSFGDSEIITKQTKTWTKEKLQRLMTSHGIRVKVQWLDYHMHFTNGFLGGENTAVSSWLWYWANESAISCWIIYHSLS